MFSLELPHRVRQNGRFMRTSFSPTRCGTIPKLAGVEHALNHKIIKTIPRQATTRSGDALGIRRNGVLVFDNEDRTSVVMDCCLYDWYENGKNLVQRYAETQNQRTKATSCRHASKQSIGFWWRYQQCRVLASTARTS